MLLMPNKKKIAAIIVGGMKPDYVQKMGEKSKDKEMDMSEAEDDDADAYSMGLEAAAEKVIKAVESKDASSLVKALKDIVEICVNDPMSEEYGDDD